MSPEGSRHFAGSAALALLVVATSLSTAAASADSGSKVQIHGFGGWAYGDTDGNRYLVGTDEGKYDNAELGLNISVRPIERLSLVAQVFLESGGDFGDGDDSDEVELDYAFAEWFFSDALKLRIGRVKHPFGLYGETFDVGTLRPFYFLPQSIYGPNGFTAKAYNGVGITGLPSSGGRWGVQYDVYVGQVDGSFDIPGLLAFSQRFRLEPNLSLGFEVEDTLGARLNLTTPVEGLTFGVSAYRGDEQVGGDLVDRQTRETFLVHAEYLTDRWSIRAEWGGLEHEGDFEEEGGYLEIGYKVDRHWQIAVRGEEWDVDFPGLPAAALTPLFRQVMRHEETAVGVNYWISPQAVLRLSYHRTDGNRFAYLTTPEEVADALARNQLEDETRLVVFGVQFSF